MDSLILLVPLSVVAVLGIGYVFWRALEGGQFDDLERPGYEILDDDDRPVRGVKRTRNPSGDIDKL